MRSRSGVTGVERLFIRSEFESLWDFLLFYVVPKGYFNFAAKTCGSVELTRIDIRRLVGISVRSYIKSSIRAL